VIFCDTFRLLLHGPAQLTPLPPPLSHSHLTLHFQVLINCRNNHKLIARVKAFDRHCNMYVISITMHRAIRPRFMSQLMGDALTENLPVVI
jgi:small nuclear ribonucleoprotein (snRNP)-like protein